MQRVQIPFNFTENVRILCLYCNVRKPITTAKILLKREETGVALMFSIMSLSRLGLYTAIVLLYTSQVPEKLLLDQLLSNTESYLALLLALKIT